MSISVESKISKIHINLDKIWLIIIYLNLDPNNKSKFIKVKR